MVLVRIRSESRHAQQSPSRREFLTAAALGVAALPNLAAAATGMQSVVAPDVIALMDALKIESAVIGAFDWGARTACILAALWPRRVKGLVSVSGYLIGSPQANKAPLPPPAELAWWCQFYFATDRGAAG